MSKGKENGRIADNVCLDRIVSFYQEKFITDQKPPPTVVEVCTNNTKCRQNFYKVAKFDDCHYGVTAERSFAQIFCLKGPWDGARKVVKSHIRE
jgi:hypothetical protein